MPTAVPVVNSRVVPDIPRFRLHILRIYNTYRRAAELLHLRIYINIGGLGMTRVA